jgi:hypothetical protein
MVLVMGGRKGNVQRSILSSGTGFFGHLFVRGTGEKLIDVVLLVNGRANGSPGPPQWLLNILLTNLEATKTHKTFN